MPTVSDELRIQVLLMGLYWFRRGNEYRDGESAKQKPLGLGDSQSKKQTKVNANEEVYALAAWARWGFSAVPYNQNSRPQEQLAESGLAAAVLKTVGP